DASAIRILDVFKVIKQFGKVPDADMQKTYNLGVGLTVVCDSAASEKIQKHFQKQKIDCYEIGRIEKGNQEVTYTGVLNW
ncbi:MAG TPA: AIR synthase-related protein, partial [Candidatus Peribacteraceae bacterium]|nr:AIR synthase-related protein [Candidatus Peribacteraceae bacterium]